MIITLRTFFVLLLLLPSRLFSQHLSSYPDNVEAVLKKAGKNRGELEQVLTYYQNNNDPLKLSAAIFLVANMDIHYSADYYWTDSTGRRLDYNELDYPDFVTAVEAFEKIKLKAGKVKPVAYTYRDIDTIKASYLINTIEQAFDVWKLPSASKLSFDDFCELILPYRVSTEPLQNWRDTYRKKFAWIADSAKLKKREDVLSDIAGELKTWFINTWNTEERQEPLPRLGAMQLLSRKKGDCDDIGGLEVFTLRSQGIPASVEHIPFWATTTGRHFFNATLDENQKNLPFDVSTASVKINNFSREPSKVVRITYGKQAGTIASLVGAEAIPPGFLRMQNYKDVTDTYWPVAPIRQELFRAVTKPPVAYACVFNGFGWKPTWWGKVRGDSVVFKDMCQGAVYLPMYYLSGKLTPAGYPVAAGYKHTTVLKPDLEHRRVVDLKQQDQYLVFRPGKNYKLYYWDKGWKLSGEQAATPGNTVMTFSDVPANALYLLIPEYSQSKERPFTMTDEGERLWW